MLTYNSILIKILGSKYWVILTFNGRPACHIKAGTKRYQVVRKAPPPEILTAKKVNKYILHWKIPHSKYFLFSPWQRTGCLPFAFRVALLVRSAQKYAMLIFIFDYSAADCANVALAIRLCQQLGRTKDESRRRSGRLGAAVSSSYLAGQVEQVQEPEPEPWC